MGNIRNILIVFAFLLALSPLSARADAVHKVRKGDTLSRIARKYKVDVERIKEANGLESDRLTRGTRLAIPGLKKRDVIRKAKRAKRGTQHLVTQEEANPKVYRIRKNDTLGEIARRFGKSVEELMALNELEDVDVKPGQELLLEPLATRAQEEKLLACALADQAAFVKPSPFAAASATSDVPVGFAALDDAATRKATEPGKAAATGFGERVLGIARKMLDIPYRFGGTSFWGADCSGYVQKVFGFLKIPLPRTAREQFAVGEKIRKEELALGDLVFFQTYARYPSHVGIYIGNNEFIHASSREGKVKIDSLDAPYYFKRFIGAKRLVTDPPAEDDREL